MKVHKLVDALSGVDPLTLVYNYGGAESIPMLTYKSVKDDIVRSQKFYLGDCDGLRSKDLIVTAEEGMSHGAIRLPFPVSYFEFDVPEHGETYGVLAVEPGNHSNYYVAMHIFVHKNSGEMTGWIDVGVVVIVTPIGNDRDEMYQMQPLVAADQYASIDNAQLVAFYGTEMVMASLAVMNARGVTLESVPEPVKLNKSRRNRGVSPVFEYRVVRIGGSFHNSHSANEHDKRSPPRLHWRRGHTRVLQSGDKTFVRAALIGNASRGVVDKHYLR